MSAQYTIHKLWSLRKKTTLEKVATFCHSPGAEIGPLKISVNVISVFLHVCLFFSSVKRVHIMVFALIIVASQISVKMNSLVTSEAHTVLKKRKCRSVF